jgi:hypothetical protein
MQGLALASVSLIASPNRPLAVAATDNGRGRRELAEELREAPPCLFSRLLPDGLPTRGRFRGVRLEATMVRKLYIYDQHIRRIGVGEESYVEKRNMRGGTARFTHFGSDKLTPSPGV